MDGGNPTIVFKKRSCSLTIPSTEDEPDGSDFSGDEEVFDPRMDFGMSILVHGKVLVTKASSGKRKNNSPSPTTFLVSSNESSLSSDAHKQSKASFLPHSAKLRVRKTKGLRNDSDSEDIEQAPTTATPHITIQIEDDSTEVDNAETISPPETLQISHVLLSESGLSPSGPSEISSVSGGSVAAQLVDIQPDLSGQSQVADQQTALDEVSAVIKSPLSASLPQLDGEIRAESPSTPMFQSVESDLRKSVSCTSDSDVYLSAESDIENFEPKPPSPAASDPGVDITDMDKKTEIEEQPVRPGHLEFHSQRESVIRKLELSPEEDDRSSSSTSPLPRKRFINEKTNGNTELTTCYSHLLASAKTKKTDWLSDFEIVEEGVHPFVVVEKAGGKHSKLQRRSSFDVFRSAAGEQCTSVVLHVKVSPLICVD